MLESTTPPPRWFKMTVAYDGTHYCGWQVQPNGTSIQSMLEKSIDLVCRERIRVTGSGRTDSGVHAMAQVASFSLAAWKATATDLCRALNSKLPSDIAISEIIDAPQDFHAIRDAVGKRYRYQLQIGGLRDAFEYRYRWHVQAPINVDAMRRAAAHLLGKHDFASFQAAGADRKTTVRDVRDLVIIDQQGMAGRMQTEPTALATGLGSATGNLEPEASAYGSRRSDSGRAGERNESRYVAIEIEADGFLYNMVRNIVGTLLEVGRGKQPPSWIEQVLQATDRTQAGPTAPPHGLFLVRVDYASFL